MVATALAALAGGCTPRDVAPAFVPYLGQAAPGAVPELFAPGVVNTGAIEINGVFAPDRRTFFFSRQVEGVFAIFPVDFVGGGWSAPRAVDVYGDGSRAEAVDMSVSADGRLLYFLGQRAHAGESGPPDFDIWVARRDGGAFRPAELVPPPVSTEHGESYPVVVADGGLDLSSEGA